MNWIILLFVAVVVANVEVINFELFTFREKMFWRSITLTKWEMLIKLLFARDASRNVEIIIIILSGNEQ